MSTLQMRSSHTLLLSFGAHGWRIAFTNCSDVPEGLESILSGWRVRRLLAGDLRKVHAHVTRTSEGYRWHSRGMSKPVLWDSNPPRNSMSVISDLHHVFFDWFLKKHPRHLCMHGAAVRLGRTLVCFPSVTKAGKSTLSVELALSGNATLNCDDVLPIEPRKNHGLARGIAPLLRKPLPQLDRSALRRFTVGREGWRKVGSQAAGAAS